MKIISDKFIKISSNEEDNLLLVYTSFILMKALIEQTKEKKASLVNSTSFS